MTHFVLNDLRCNTYQSRRRQRSSWPAGGPAHSAMHERERGMSISTRGSAVPYEAPRSPGFRRMFREGHLTLGLFFAIESYVTDMPTMAGQVELARKAEADGFAALWTRDVPLRDPTFGEVGQIFDPWVWRGYVTAHTSTIALATGAIVLPIIRCTWRRRPRPCTTCRWDGSCWGGLRRPANRVSRVRSRYRSGWLTFSRVACIHARRGAARRLAWCRINAWRIAWRRACSNAAL